MTRFCIIFLFLGLLTDLAAASARQIEFNYQATITPTKNGGVTEIFLPLAAENAQQKRLSETIDSPIKGAIKTEDVYGNRYWHATLSENQGPIKISIKTVIERTDQSDLAPVDENKLGLYLRANEKVVVNDPILDPIRAEIEAKVDVNDRASMSRGIYDWVVDNIEYKKVGTGWGNGDTFWACNERYGNCTDFHALFISLARSYEIPSRFEIGFPIPLDRDEGSISGYHCWVQFHDQQQGWFPIDASEAAKAPAKREYYYGAHPSDRIQFTTGRDLRLGEHHKAKPLNYFIYPHVEQGGKAFEGTIEKNFEYRCLNGCDSKHS